MRRLLKATFRLAGLEVRRVPPAKPSGFYPTQPSCQVPDIGFLLELYFGRRSDGVFVEVGAYDGVSFSNTWGLAERGWRGLMIEPVPELAAACTRAHARHPAVTVVNTAVGPAGVTQVRLWLAGALTTAADDQLDEYRRAGWMSNLPSARSVDVPCRTLDEVLADAGLEPGFEVLVVDVEGQEEGVFSSFDLERWRPQMMIVELADTHPELSVRRSADFALHRRLLSAGYWTAYKDAINTVLVRDDTAESAYGRRAGSSLPGDAP